MAGNSTVSSMLKYGKTAGKSSIAGSKARSTILKSAVRAAIKTNKPTKFSKLTGVKPQKVPKSTFNLGKSLTSEMRKAKKKFI